MLALDAVQRLLQPFDQFGRGRTLDHGISIVADPVGVRLNLGFISICDLPVRPL